MEETIYGDNKLQLFITYFLTNRECYCLPNFLRTKVEVLCQRLIRAAYFSLFREEV